MPTNTNCLFYKKYYEANTPTELANVNAEITGMSIQPIVPVFDGVNANHINLYTTYPGLLIGSGYQHEYKNPDNTKMQEDAFKIGFYFDYTTGMPVIPGSSIKGMLRSCFPQQAVTTKKLSSDFSASRTQFIKDTFNTVLGINEKIDVDAIEDEIFHGKRDGKPIPMYQRDIFFQAVPVAVHNTEKKLLNTDYITPHIKENLSYEESMLKNPVPIKFLKVAPNVQYRFEFKLSDSRVCKSLTKEKKQQLFEYLISTLGVGAKTNVGYGQFSKTALVPSVLVAENHGNRAEREGRQQGQNRNGNYKYHQQTEKLETKTKIDLLQEKAALQHTVSSPKLDESNFTSVDKLKVGDVVDATFVSFSGGNNKIKLHVKNSVLMNVPGAEIKTTALKVKIKETSGKIEKGNYAITKVELVK